MRGAATLQIQSKSELMQTSALLLNDHQTSPNRCSPVKDCFDIQVMRLHEEMLANWVMKGHLSQRKQRFASAGEPEIPDPDCRRAIHIGRPRDGFPQLCTVS